MDRPRTIFRPLDGILLLDKSPGMSSNQALQRARHLFRADKAGHTGSLDPLATGLLPLCFGEATKIAGLLLGNRKTYETTARLGATTDSDDSDGQVLRERPVPAFDRGRVEDMLRRFVGTISQRPPIYSALKQGGEPLYAKARRGEAITVPERVVEVQAIELLELGADWLTLRIACGSGTYIRSIVRDLGEAIGCGAHVTQLRRTSVEPFVAPAMHTLDALAALREEQGEAALDALVLSVESGLQGLPSVALDAAQAQALGRGQRVRPAAGIVPGTTAVAELVARGPEGSALGLVALAPDGSLRVRRLFRWAAAG